MRGPGQLYRSYAHPCRHFSASTASRSERIGDLPVNTNILSLISSRAIAHLRALEGTQAADERLSEDGRRTVHLRRNGTALPLPPALDKNVIARRNEHTTARPFPRWKDPTAFQKELMGNAFAQILATPLRRDTCTQTLLPRFFLQALGTRFRPPPPSKPGATTSKARKQAPHAELVPHLYATRADAEDGSGPKMYALSGARLQLLRSTVAAVGLRQERRFGLRRHQWHTDPQELRKQAEELLHTKVEGQLKRLVRKELLGSKGVKVVLDPRKAEEGHTSGYQFVLPPGLARKEWAKDLGREVEFAMDERTVGAVVALLEMDLFYRSAERGGRDEILQVWAAVDKEAES